MKTVTKIAIAGGLALFFGGCASDKVGPNGFKRNMTCYTENNEEIMITMYKSPMTSTPTIQMYVDYVNAQDFDDDLIITKTSIRADNTASRQIMQILLTGPISVITGGLDNDGAFVDAETGTALYRGKVYKCNKREVLYQLSFMQ